MRGTEAEEHKDLAGAFVEDGCEAARVAGPMARELSAMAGWLGLDAVTVAARGDLAPALLRAVGQAAGTE